MSGKSQPTVLAVDDERAVVDLYDDWLDDEYDVRTATSGVEALRRIDEETDVVLLDRRMPDASGDEVLTEIRERGYSCRVAMITAVEPRSDIIEMGFDEYIVKPVAKPTLCQTVESMQARNEYDASLREYFALLSKRAALRSTTAAESDSYAPLLTERISALERQLEDQLADFTEWDFKAMFATFSPRADGPGAAGESEASE